MNQTQIRYILAAGWGIYAGVAAGWFLSKRKWQKIADEEIENVKEHYYNRQAAILRSNLRAVEEELDVERNESRHLAEVPPHSDEELRPVSESPFLKPGDPEDDESAELQKEVEQIAHDLKYHDLDTIEPEELEPNVKFEPTDFDETPPEGRKYPLTEPENPDRPYVISVEEFMDDEPVYDKMTLTYYEADDILSDDNGKVVRSIDRVIGDQALINFGNRSDDNHVVYVRNEPLKTDYEVALEERAYTEVVLKLTPKGNKKRRLPEDE